MQVSHIGPLLAKVSPEAGGAEKGYSGHLDT